MPKLSGSIKLTLDTKKLDALINGTGPKAKQVLDIAARSIERQAKEVVAVDTGALRNSIHVETPGPFERVIADAVEYGVFIEFGTGRMAARPFLTPAVEAERPRFLKAWEALFK